jgi:hypothetical protein
MSRRHGNARGNRHAWENGPIRLKDPGEPAPQVSDRTVGKAPPGGGNPTPESDSAKPAPPGSWYVGSAAPGPLVATGARVARWHLGPCAACGWAVLAGDRAADLYPGGQAVHVSCARLL